MTTLKKLLARTEAFLKENDMTATQFGINVMSDPNFVFELRQGRNVRISTVDKVDAYIEKATKALT